MIETLAAPDHVVALRVTGRIDEADIARAIEVVEAALAQHERVALYAEVDMAGMTPGAFAKDLQYGLGKLRELRRFPRVAVVTSQEWVRWAARLEGAILPQIEVRVFSPAEREEALAWASQPLPAHEAEAEPKEPSVRTMRTTSPNVIAFEVDGRIRGEDMRRLIAASDEVMKAHEHVRVLVRVLRFDGVGLDALREEGLAAMKMRGFRQVDRYALVGGPPWMTTVAGWSAPLVRVQTRHFDLGEEEEAWRWIGAEPAPEGAAG
jgi:SpoIIAA-like